MNKLTRVLLMLALLGSTLLASLSLSSSSRALIPANHHRHRYIRPDYTYAYYITNKESYIKDTLPNEWIPSWYAETLKAGAVIIRSGVYWRVNRSDSSWPNNNCYKGGSGATLYYRTVPNSRGGEEEWLPSSSQSATNSATDATYGYHSERVSLPAGRPDKLVPLRYNSTIQNRTNSLSQWQTWLTRIRYAYLDMGSPFDPNVECSQTDDQTSSDPTYINN